MNQKVNIHEITKAYLRIKKYTLLTPLLSSEIFNKEFNTNIFIKAENLQKIGGKKEVKLLNI